MEQTSKADFRALREGIGLTQQNVADMCGVKVNAVKRWERVGWPDPPDDAWDALEAMADRHDELVAFGVAKALELSAQTGAPDVVLTYYHDQGQYDALGRDEGPYGFVNAVARDVAAELSAKGMDVAFRYPDDGAVRTPGSCY